LEEDEVPALGDALHARLELVDRRRPLREHPRVLRPVLHLAERAHALELVHGHELAQRGPVCGRRAVRHQPLHRAGEAEGRAGQRPVAHRRGPRGRMWGRSAVVSKPAGAAHTYGMALTGPLALKAGTKFARSSRGTGNGMLTSKGASPWMRTRQPVGCRPQSGSTSMATKPYCVNRIRSTPPIRPWMTIRCAAAVPFLI